MSHSAEPVPAQQAPRAMSPQVRDAVRRQLTAMAAEDDRLMREVHALPGAAHRRQHLYGARALHTAELRHLVNYHGWPTAVLVGGEASAAALKILLHAPETDRDFVLTCCGLIQTAVAEGACDTAYGAYAHDLSAVRQGRHQRYGTQVDPRLLRPYPIENPEGVEARRSAVGLQPLSGELAAHQRRRLLIS
ncbi:DUF6624 domain-containing protein [Streptomyces sp. NPDC018019]|uniref:DUF6624 domain-containing protein n=1 Tax=Streptomyces sp. NPDC018019 TaxID=3365030 RepID=UPI0037908CBF